jgi:diphthamide biosynthesis protein 3
LDLTLYNPHSKNSRPISPSANSKRTTTTTNREKNSTAKMSDDEQISIYDEVEIEDMTYDETLQLYHYPCPCGDRFEIALHDLMDGEDNGVCPSCSLMIRVIFEVVSSSLFLASLGASRLVGLVL